MLRRSGRRWTGLSPRDGSPRPVGAVARNRDGVPPRGPRARAVGHGQPGGRCRVCRAATGRGGAGAVLRRSYGGCAAPAATGVLFRQRRRWAAAARTGLVRSKPLVLAHLLATLAVCAATGLRGVGGGAGGGHGRRCTCAAAARVGLTRRRCGSAVSPSVVGWLAGVTLAGMVRGTPAPGTAPRGWGKGRRCEVRPTAALGKAHCADENPLRGFSRGRAHLRRRPPPRTHARRARPPRAFDVSAAFFLVGNRIAAAPHLPQRITDAGHASATTPSRTAGTGGVTPRCHSPT